MSAASRKEWQARPCAADDGQLSGTPFPQQGLRSTTRNRRAQMAFPRWRQTFPLMNLGYLLALIVSFLIVPASAVLLEFDNCLSESYKNGNPKQLQFVPYWLDAVFNTTDPSHNLQVTVWGDVTGFIGQNQSAPPLNSNPLSYWSPVNDSTVYGGKIINIPNAGSTDPNLVKYTTLSNKVNVLTYEPYDHSEQFCANLVNFSCPLGPAVKAEPYVEPLR